MNRNARKLEAILNKTLVMLGTADELVARAGINPPGETVKTLNRACSEVLRAREALRESLRAPEPAAKLQPGVQEEAGLIPPPRTGIFGLRRGRARFFLQTTRDITRMALRLLLPWRLPNIKVGFAETLPTLEVQRTQTRITQRSDACLRLVAGPLLAAATVVIGAFYLVWKWTRDFNDLAYVVIAALCAWVIGNVLNMAWCRFRLLLELLRLRYQVGRARKFVAGTAA
jgi:hypothetical protein